MGQRLCTRLAYSAGGGLDALEGAPFVKNRPGDAGELVGERNRQHVVVEALLGSLDPRLEAGYIDARPLTPARQNLLQRTANNTKPGGYR
jgi:hypothetical protein